MTNVDPKLASYRDRILNLETAKRAAAEDIKEVKVEMKSGGYTDIQIGGVLKSVKRSLTSAAKRAREKAIENEADQYDLFLGDEAA